TQSKSKSFFKMKWMNEINRKDNINCDKIVPVNLGMLISLFLFTAKNKMAMVTIIIQMRLR
ncbi:hypothetical protein LEP1GSC170_4369, partial [Leptospira interrogans serovar Bataviae str. HAI135]